MSLDWNTNGFNTRRRVSWVLLRREKRVSCIEDSQQSKFVVLLCCDGGCACVWIYVCTRPPALEDNKTRWNNPNNKFADQSIYHCWFLLMWLPWCTLRPLYSSRIKVSMCLTVTLAPPSVLSALYKSTIKPSWWQDRFWDGTHKFWWSSQFLPMISSLWELTRNGHPLSNKMIARLSPALQRAWKIALTIFGLYRRRIAC